MKKKKSAPPPRRLLELLAARRAEVRAARFRVGFNNGTLLEDPHGLLAGTGARMRHIRVASKQDLERPLRVYVRAAVEFAAESAALRAGIKRRA